MFATAALLATLAAGVGAAQSTCRPTALGTVGCPVAPPKPRPVYQADTQAIDRVRRRTGAEDPAPVLVPAWRTDRLGNTTLGPGELGGRGLCSRDNLGNLICP